MISFVSVNWLAILVSGIVSMALGFLWYCKPVFGSKFMKLCGMDKMSPKEIKAMQAGMGVTYVKAFISALIVSFVLAQLIGLLQITSIVDVLSLVVLLWFGFAYTTGLNNVLFEKKNRQLFFIDTGYSLVQYALIGIIVVLMA
ncbi:Uncharacterised protein [uncultured archaeon]|nr:Uncharacterised protein [uncultured archaeon]